MIGNAVSNTSDMTYLRFLSGYGWKITRLLHWPHNLQCTVHFLSNHSCFKQSKFKMKGLFFVKEVEPDSVPPLWCVHCLPGTRTGWPMTPSGSASESLPVSQLWWALWPQCWVMCCQVWRINKHPFLLHILVSFLPLIILLECRGLTGDSWFAWNHHP